MERRIGILSVDVAHSFFEWDPLVSKSACDPSANRGYDDCVYREVVGDAASSSRRCVPPLLPRWALDQAGGNLTLCVDARDAAVAVGRYDYFLKGFLRWKGCSEPCRIMQVKH